MKKRQAIILMILALLIELILKSSNIPSLVGISLLTILFITILQKESSVLSIFLFILFSIILELFSFKTIGVTSLSLFLAILGVKFIGNFIHFFNLARRNTLSLVLLYFLFLLFRFIIGAILKSEEIFDFGNTLINILILLLLNIFISKVFNNKYVLE